jgi:DNA-binding NtrC family response regulator
MIRIALCSNDRTLQSLLSSALGRDFEVSEQTSLKASASVCDVVLLDLDSRQDIAPADMSGLIASTTPLILLASDTLRSTALDLVRQGAYSYCRRPPSIRELKTTLIRAHESARYDVNF